MFQKTVQRLHQFDDSDVRAVVDEVVIGIGGVSPAPRIGEGVELRLTHLPTRLAKENVVIGIRVKRWIEINKIDTRIGKFFPVGKPLQVVAEIEAVHRFTFLPDIGLSVQSTRCPSTAKLRDRETRSLRQVSDGTRALPLRQEVVDLIRSTSERKVRCSFARFY